MEILREITCSGCSSLILRKSRDGFWRFSTKVMKSTSDGNGVVAVCRACGNEELMPITIAMRPVESNLSKSGVVPAFSVREKKPLD